MDIKKARSWAATIQVQNMKDAGLTDAEITNPEYTAEFFKRKWEESGLDRKACVATCLSQNGLYHMHAALYGSPTTINVVKNCMFGAHVEPLKSKIEMSRYILKEGKYSEKNETVLYVAGKEHLDTNPGHRTDLDIIQEQIHQGYTPDEIMGGNLHNRRYSRLINAEYDYQNRRNAPLKRVMHREWHFGDYDSGKEYFTNENLCMKYGKDKVYLIQYVSKGSFDKYNERGNPPVIVIDDVDYDTNINDLLNILNEYTNTQIECRYCDITPLWTEVHINSLLSPEEYAGTVGVSKSKFAKLLSKLDFITYHYTDNGMYMKYSIPVKQYTDKNSLIELAKKQNGGTNYVQI